VHGRQIIQREVAAHGADILGDGAGERTPVEHVGAVLGDGAQRAGQIGHREPPDRIRIDGGRSHRREAFGQEASGGARIARKVGHGGGDHQRRVPVDHDAVLRQLGRRRDEVAPGEPPEALVSGSHARRLGRRHHGLGTHGVEVALHHRPAEQVALVALVGQHEVRRIERFR
jgi:hypothetical protein